MYTVELEKMSKMLKDLQHETLSLRPLLALHRSMTDDRRRSRAFRFSKGAAWVGTVLDLILSNTTS